MEVIEIQGKQITYKEKTTAQVILDGGKGKLNIQALVVDSLINDEAIVDRETLINWGFPPQKWPSQLVETAARGIGPEERMQYCQTANSANKVIENKNNNNKCLNVNILKGSMGIEALPEDKIIKCSQSNTFLKTEDVLFNTDTGFQPTKGNKVTMQG